LDDKTNSKPQSIGPNEPKLTVGPVSNNVYKDDILPVKNDIEYVNPDNHTISLPDGMVKKGNIIEKKTNRKKVYGVGINKRKKSGGNINKILTQKSKDILKGIVR